MKPTLAKLMLTMLTVALLASCAGTGTNPDQTGDAGKTAATEAATEATTEAVDKTAEYESYLDSVLAEYEAVYITKTDGYPDGGDLLQNPEKYPEKMAVRVSDMPGLAFTVSRDGWVGQIYAFGRENISEPIPYRFFVGRMTVDTDTNTILVSTESGANPAYQDGYYIITEPQTYYLSARDGDFAVSLQLDWESSVISYTKKHSNYLGVEQSFLSWFSAYTGEDTVYKEYGTISLGEKEAKFICERSLTLNEWYKSDEFATATESRSDFEKMRDIWEYDTFIDFLFRYARENDMGDLSSYWHLPADSRKIDITAEENIPFRLIGMTFAEIEAEFGPLTREYLAMGGSPVYVSDKLPEIKIMFLTGGTIVDGMNAASGEDMPFHILVGDLEVFPGIRRNMTAEKVSGLLPEMDPTKGNFTYSEMGAYPTYYKIDGYTIQVNWAFPDETCAELESNMLNDNKSEVYWQDHRFNGYVFSFQISKTK